MEDMGHDPAFVDEPGSEDFEHAAAELHAGEALHEGLDSPFEERDGGEEAGPYKHHHSPEPPPPQPGSPSGSAGAASLVGATAALLLRLPGVRALSVLNATLLALLGLGAALAAWAGGAAVLAVLLARWYLPAHVTAASLPLHLDYAAGAGAARAWAPLLRATPLTAALSPPPPPPGRAPGAPGAPGLTFTGSLGPGGSFSVASPDGGQQGSLLGPGGDAAAAAAGAPRRRGAGGGAAAGGGGAAAAGGVDVGGGAVVPAADWLVPLQGRTRVVIDLTLPAWPEADLLQARRPAGGAAGGAGAARRPATAARRTGRRARRGVAPRAGQAPRAARRPQPAAPPTAAAAAPQVTGELVSQQGIVLARASRAWMPRRRSLLRRLASTLLLGPWRALGLLDDTTRVSLPLFEAFQNPSPPPGGWAAVPELRDPHPARPGGDACDAAGGGGAKAPARGKGGTTAAGGGGGRGTPAAEVSGPRAMWLRVSVAGRSPGVGPPKVFAATAHLRVRLGLLDWLASALRPSLLVCALLAVGGLGLAVGGGGAALVLLPLAYCVYRLGAPAAAGAARRAARGDAAAPAPRGDGDAAALEDEWEEAGGEFGPDDGAGSSGGSGSPLAFGASLDGGAHLDGRFEPFGADGGAGAYFEPGDAAADFYDAASDATGSARSARSGSARGAGGAAAVELQPLRRGGGSSASASASSGRSDHAAAGGGGGGAVSAIWRMLGLQQQQQEPAPHGGGAAAAGAAGGRRGWGPASALVLEGEHDGRGFAGIAEGEDEGAASPGDLPSWRGELLAESEEEGDDDEAWARQEHAAKGAAAAGGVDEDEASTGTGAAGLSSRRRLGYAYRASQPARAVSAAAVRGGGGSSAERQQQQSAAAAAALVAAALLALSPPALAEEDECFGPTCLKAGREAIEALKGVNDAQKAKLSAAEDAFSTSPTLKALLERSEANRAKNKKAIENKYCYRQAELGIGDCGGLRLIPGMTKNGKQPTPEFLQKALGIEGKIPKQEGEGKTIEELLGGAPEGSPEPAAAASAPAAAAAASSSPRSQRSPDWAQRSRAASRMLRARPGACAPSRAPSRAASARCACHEIARPVALPTSRRAALAALLAGLAGASRPAWAVTPPPPAPEPAPEPAVAEQQQALPQPPPPLDGGAPAPPSTEGGPPPPPSPADGAQPQQPLGQPAPAPDAGALAPPQPAAAQPPDAGAPPAPPGAPSFQLTQEEAQRLLDDEDAKRRARRRLKKGPFSGRLRELEEMRAELAEKEITLLQKEQQLLDREQTLLVLKEELELERKLRALLTREKERAEEEAALAMGLCTGGAMLPPQLALPLPAAGTMAEAKTLVVEVASCNVKKLDLKAYGVTKQRSYVVVKVGDVEKKTTVGLGLDPTWEETFEFDVADENTTRCYVSFFMGAEGEEKRIGDECEYLLNVLVVAKPTYKGLIVPGGKVDMMFTARGFGKEDVPVDDSALLDLMDGGEMCMDSDDETAMSTMCCASRPLTAQARRGAVAPAARLRLRRAQAPVQARFGGGGVADWPAGADIDVTKRSGGWDSDRDGGVLTVARPDTGSDGGSTDRSPPGGGNHRLLLLDSPRHREAMVVRALTQVVSGCDEPHARNCYATSKQLGAAIVTSCLKEHAEHFMQALYRCGVRTAIEPDNTTA
ncbi:hypothetical protein HT031_002824 [Scenedesmus sp. PABB004]|nr:hypothetical protein HT031_002824 [Scenedesmus sp. PABB004]